MVLNKLKGVLVALALVVAALAGGGGYLLPTHAGGQGTGLTIPLQAGGEKKSADEDFNKTILAMEAKYWEAVRKFDVDALKMIYADDFLHFSARGRSDKAANLEVANRLGNDNITFRDVEIVRLNRDGAVITYRLDCDTVTRDGAVTFRWRDHRVSHTWARRDGRWVLVFSQMTQMPTAGAGARR
jgi:ketosteroid isomerase-like protein